MEKAKGVGKLHSLPFTTFGEMTALRFKATVYCSRCYEHRPIDLAAQHLRDRCFATTRFRCTKIRYTGETCGGTGSVEVEPSAPLAVGGEYNLAFLSCAKCAPPWQINFVPIDEPPWSVVNRDRGDRFRCPGCHRPVAWHIHGPSWHPPGSGELSGIALALESNNLGPAGFPHNRRRVVARRLLLLMKRWSCCCAARRSGPIKQSASIVATTKWVVVGAP
jgi:hypothetical protein